MGLAGVRSAVGLCGPASSAGSRPLRLLLLWSCENTRPFISSPQEEEGGGGGGLQWTFYANLRGCSSHQSPSCGSTRPLARLLVG